MKKMLSILLLVVLLISATGTAFASTLVGPGLKDLNYQKYPGVLSGTFEVEWCKGSVGRFNDYPVYVGMEYMLRLDGGASANCHVGAAVRKFSGSSSTYVSAVIVPFNAYNTGSSQKFYPANGVYGAIFDTSFDPVAGTYAYVVKSTGPDSLAGMYAAYMNDRLG